MLITRRIGKANLLRALTLIISVAMLLVLYQPSDAFQHQQSDILRQELELQGGFDDLLARWRVNDGKTVSVLWDFPTEQRENIQPSIEVPHPGEYSWYTGSRVDILHPDAIWTTDGGWQLNVQGQDVPMMSGEDTNPESPTAKKDFYVAFWYKEAVWVEIDEPRSPTEIEPPRGWASRLYPGWMFVIKHYISGPPCPQKVKATVKVGNRRAEIKAVAVWGKCQE